MSEFFYFEICCRYGVPESIRTDYGRSPDNEIVVNLHHIGILQSIVPMPATASRLPREGQNIYMLDLSIVFLRFIVWLHNVLGHRAFNPLLLFLPLLSPPSPPSPSLSPLFSSPACPLLLTASSLRQFETHFSLTMSSGRG